MDVSHSADVEMTTEVDGQNGGGDQGKQGDDGSMNNSNSNNDGVHPGTARSYKEMLEVLKQVHKSCDSMTERICDLNLKYADLITKAALLIDPDVAKILHGDGADFPEVLNASQQSDKVRSDELDEKYQDMCTTLDQGFQQRE